MSNNSPRAIEVLHRRTVTKVVALYVSFAGLWIYFSDEVLAWFIHAPEQLTQAQTIKGWFFVAVTALLLFCYLSHCLKRLRDQEDLLSREKDKAEQEIKNRFKQLNTLFDAMNAVVYVADMESYELLYVNKFAAELFGRDWQGQKCYNYLQNNMGQPCEFCTNPQLISNGEAGPPVSWQFLNTRDNRWYECFDKAIRWTDGRMVRLEIALDITERKELERIKDNLLSSMSHEMRTPLTAISGFSEILMTEEDIPEHHRLHIELIFREAERMTALVNNFLDVRRLKVDRSRIDYEYLQLSALLNKGKQNCRECREVHKITIDCPDELQVYGNRKELTQVITQLLENSCRYSPAGGDILVTAKADDKESTITVSDQGIGIPHYELDAIFAPFHKLDTGDNRRTRGVGLGLSIAREIVALHGGTMKAESLPGQGSRFIVTLPRPATPHNGESICNGETEA